MLRPSLPYRLFFGLLLLGGQVWAQSTSLLFERLSVQDGLSSNKVTALLQDPQGFIWVGTEDGLQRYDGENFLDFPVESEDKPAAYSLGRINHLAVDGKGRIWASTEKEGQVVIVQNGDLALKLGHYEVSDSRISINRANQALPWTDGQVLLASRDGLHKFISRDSIPRAWQSPGLPDYTDVVTCLAETGEGWVWAGTYQGVHKIDPLTGREYGISSDLARIRGKVEVLEADPVSGHLWIGTDGAEMFRYDPRTEALDSIPYHTSPDLRSDNRPTALCRDRDGTVWMGTRGHGLYRMRPGDDFFQAYQGNPRLPGSQLPVSIYALLTDAQGNVWLGTEEGLFKFHPGHQAFHFIPPVDQTGNPIRNEWFSQILRTRDGSIWLGGLQSGLSKLGSDNRLQQVKLPNTAPNWFPNVLAEDENGRIWLGSNRDLRWLDYFSGETKVVTALRSHFSKIVFGLQALPGGDIYVALPIPDFVRYSPETDSIATIPMANRFPERGGCRFTAVAQFDARTLLVGTAACGLRTFDLESMSFDQQVLHEKLPGREDVYPEIENVVVIGDTALFSIVAGGFGLLPRSTLQPQRYRKRDGLCNDRVAGYLQHRGRYWIFTEHGISIFHPGSGTFQNLNHENGLLEDNFTCQPTQDPETGEVIATTSNYLLRFHPDSLQTPPPPPSVILLGMDLFGKRVATGAWDDTPATLQVPYHSNMFTLHFASLNYFQSAAVTYEYQLLGFDNAWLPNGASRFLRFTNLPGGAYTLKVRASGPDGRWNTPTTLARIYVETPFWRTWWFYLLLALAFAGLVYLVYRVRLRRVLEIMRLRSKISRDLHDEIGSSLSSISILSQLLLSRRDKLAESDRKVVENISAHAGQTMSSMDDIIWTIHPDNDKAENVLIRMRQLVTELLEPLDISVDMDLDERLEKLDFSLDQRWHLTMLFKEILNNIAKHAGASQVSIRLQLQGQQLLLQVRDNGRGFDPQQPSSRNGLRNLRERADALRGQLEIESAPGAGCQTTLRFAR